ncbi:hypothetical protein TRFO_35231 [Tritrichomonas foetus]|uniref:RRM domain-containing protein n=1 Tax=Tritrichomonas foetus TaxID=1144522 RepID=A0A1J4JJ95_9EUKA|nr:hypothetical protein TRFO_35231 [Tritrichomonas foetus]|eukprot:OHS98407.1 hypothetical protein TRFO_35231 [Tritrichomonas foetus]
MNQSLPPCHMPPISNPPLLQKRHNSRLLPPSRRKSTNRVRGHNVAVTPRVVVSNFPLSFKKEQIREICSQYGEIEGLEKVRKGKFIIIFKNAKTAHTAILSLNGLQIIEDVSENNTLNENNAIVQNEIIIDENDDKKCVHTLKAKYENSEVENRASLAIIAKRIPNEVDLETLKRQFAIFGDIANIYPYHENFNYYRCKITFKSYESSFNAINAMNCKVISPDTKPILVGYAPPEIPLNNRRKTLSRQFSMELMMPIIEQAC